MSDKPDTSRHERPNLFPWPPVIFGICLVAGYLLNRFAPLGFPGGFAGEMAFAFGLLLIAVALALDIATMMTLARADTTIMPHKGSTHLVTGGPFKLSRNPIYVANVTLLIGFGLVMGNAWLLLLAPLDGYLTQKLAIEREEKHLEHRFGKPYRQYKTKVNRWL